MGGHDFMRVVVENVDWKEEEEEFQQEQRNVRNLKETRKGHNERKQTQKRPGARTSEKY